MRYLSIVLLAVLPMQVQAQTDTINTQFPRAEAVHWSPDGRMLATQSADHNDDYLVFIEIWDVETYDLIANLEADLFAIQDFVWSPDSSMVAAYCRRRGPYGTERTVDIWRVEYETFKSIQSPGPYRDVYPDYRHFDAFGDGEVYPEIEDPIFPIQIAWSPDSTMFAASFVDGIRIYQVGDEEPVTVIPLTNVMSLDWSPNGGRLAVGLNNSTVEILEVP